MPTNPTNHTPRKTYRLGTETTERIERLAAHLGASDTDIIRYAVSVLYRQELPGKAGAAGSPKKTRKKSRVAS